jgi:hypothetical protein
MCVLQTQVTAQMTDLTRGQVMGSGYAALDHGSEIATR